MTSFLVRHAKAGSREKWVGPDDQRPLTPAGLRQAEGLFEQLKGEQVRCVLSSPYVRCVQTVAPLAAARGLRVELEDRLAEGAGPDWVLEVVGTEAGLVLCSHGDVVASAVLALAEQGVQLGELRWEKGSTWALEASGGKIVAGRYLPPPDR